MHVSLQLDIQLLILILLLVSLVQNKCFNDFSFKFYIDFSIYCEMCFIITLLGGYHY